MKLWFFISTWVNTIVSAEQHFMQLAPGVRYFIFHKNVNVYVHIYQTGGGNVRKYPRV